MISFKEMNSYLEARSARKYFIPSASDNFCLDMDIVENLQEMSKKYPMTEIAKCFSPNEKPYNFKINCSSCDEIILTQISKTKFLEIVKGSEVNFLCRQCKEEAKCLEKQKNEEDKNNRENEKCLSTLRWCEYYLNPEIKIDFSAKLWEIWDDMTLKYYFSAVFWDYISFRINSLPYNEFLSTPYWKIISQKKKKEALWKCQLCGNKGSLATHHRTYEIHGREHECLKDLVVLCNGCHSKFHDKIK